MENATKALMIAAAVLVAILIISLGIGIFTSASEQMGDMDMSEYQNKAINDKFTPYIGTKVSGAEVNALLTAVFNHNMSQEDKETRVAVKFTGDVGKPTDWKNVSISNKPTAAYAKLSTAYNYKVTAKYNTKTGLINNITIEGIQ